MKKNILFGAVLFMTAAFTACNEEFTDWASPISYPQPDAITIPGLTASPAAASIDLGQVDDTVKIISLSSATMPEGTKLDKMRIYLYPTDMDGAEQKLLTAISAADGTFDRDVLQEMVVELFGPRPTTRTYDAHVYLDGIYKGQAAFIDAGEVQLNFIPEAPIISDNYYIVGGTLDWAGSAASKEQKFNHSGLDVYEDPVFSIVIDAAEGDTWFAIGDDEGCDAITNNGDWSKLLGTTSGNGESGEAGTLDYRYNLKDDGSFKVPAGAKKIKVDLNMMDRTYTVTPVSIAENYYLIGGPGNWDSSKNQKFSHSSKDVFEDPVFTYTFESTGGDMWFAFGDDEAIDAVGENTWNKLFGTTGASEDLKGSFDRRYNLDGDHSFHVDGSAKYYRLTVNMAEMTYEIQPLNFTQFIYFIGATDGWNNEEQNRQRLESPASDGFYSGYLYVADPNNWGIDFKFQQTLGSWDDEINYATYGTVSGDLQQGGGTNFQVTKGEGVYYMTIDMTSGNVYAEKVENMNLVGGFNGWNQADDAQQMTWDAENYCFVKQNAGVTADGWKFTINNAWAINLGSNDSTEPSSLITDLVGNGKNIGVVGTTIKLYPTRRTSDKIYCTVE